MTNYQAELVANLNERILFVSTKLKAMTSEMKKAKELTTFVTLQRTVRELEARLTELRIDLFETMEDLRTDVTGEQWGVGRA